MKIINVCVIAITMGMLSACVENKEETEAFVNQVKSSAVGAVDTIPPNKIYKTVEYRGESLRNPFVAMRQAVPEPAAITPQQSETKNALVQQPRPDAKRPREYLEQFPITSFVMVGTLSKPDMNWGLIKDSNGMIYAVKNGDYLGQNSGKIIAVTPDQIRVVETVPNGAGGWMRAKATIMLVPEGTNSE